MRRDDEAVFCHSDLAVVRVRRDINELSKADFTCPQARTRIDFPEGPTNLLRLVLTISIVEHNAGPYANGDFSFYIEIPKTYPFHPPCVTSLTRLWHPNVDVITGKVMLSILARDWRPVLSINAVLLGLQLVLLEPSLEFVVNPLAAQQFESNPSGFRDHVQRLLQGGTFYDLEFPSHKRAVVAAKSIANATTDHARRRKNEVCNNSNSNSSRKRQRGFIKEEDQKQRRDRTGSMPTSSSDSLTQLFTSTPMSSCGLKRPRLAKQLELVEPVDTVEPTRMVWHQ